MHRHVARKLTHALHVFAGHSKIQNRESTRDMLTLAIERVLAERSQFRSITPFKLQKPHMKHQNQENESGNLPASSLKS